MEGSREEEWLLFLIASLRSVCAITGGSTTARLLCSLLSTLSKSLLRGRDTDQCTAFVAKVESMVREDLVLLHGASLHTVLERRRLPYVTDRNSVEYRMANESPDCKVLRKEEFVQLQRRESSRPGRSVKLQDKKYYIGDDYRRRRHLLDKFQRQFEEENAAEPRSEY